MNKGFKVLAITALIAAGTVAGQGLYANCQNEGPYEVRQCANGSWFAPAPVGAGTVDITWWGIGFGNRNVNTAPGAGIVAADGSAFLAAPSPGQFIGVDSGLLSLAGLDVVDGSTIQGLGAPAGSFCLSSAANWGAPGTDSCIDINRTNAAGGGTTSQSDNFANRYWGDTYGAGVGYLTLENQVDPPMGVMMTESTGKFFAAAFFATTRKVSPVEADLDPGQFNMAALTNGDVNPFGPVIVPWQPVPQPSVAATLSNPLDPLSTRNLQFDWTLPRFINDGSSRPCFLFDGTTRCTTVPVGVGVLDQGALMHFQVETSPIDATGACGTVWTPAGTPVDPPATSIALTGIAPDTCVRLKTSFGKTPTSAMRTVANAGNVAANRLDAQTGKLGDLGYNTFSAPTKIGGTLVSQKATLKTASREQGNLRVAFDTDTELNVTGFDVVGIDGKGGRKVLGSVTCSQCTTGLGASYDTVVSGAKLQGAKKVQIVMQPSGVQSNTLNVK